MNKIGIQDKVELAGQFLFVFVLYIVTARLGLSLYPVSDFATPIWPPTGIAIAYLWLWGYRLWPAVAAGAIAANFLNGGSLPLSVVIAAGNTLEAIAAVAILRRAAFKPTLQRTRDVLALSGAALVGALISASVGVSALVVGNNLPLADYLFTWSAWWTGDVLGAITIAPLLLIWSRWRKQLNLSRPAWEKISFALLLLAIAAWVFQSAPSQVIPGTYLLFPPLIWIALRATTRVTVTMVFCTKIIALIGTIQQRGPFTAPVPAASLQALQLFMGVIAFTIFLLAAAAAERRHLQRRLRHALANVTSKLDEVEQIAHIGSWEWDITANNVTWSTELYRLYGLKPGERITYEKFVAHVHPADRTLAQETVRVAQATQRPFAYDHRIIQPDGQTRWLHASGTVVVDANQKPVKMVGIAQDITERKAIEEAKEQQLQQERGFERREREFVSMASHQLMTPLALIKGYISMLLSGKLEASEVEMKQYLQEALQGADRMTRFIQNLLTISRIESGSLKVELAPVDVSALAREACAAFKQQAAAKHLSLHCQADQPVLAQANADHTREALFNLISNAIKYTPEGTVTVSAATAGRTARLTVKDTGVGISTKDLTKIFTKFNMSANWIAKQAESTGLGLYISKLLVEAMDGTIEVTSGQGKGSAFSIILPLANS